MIDDDEFNAAAARGQAAIDRLNRMLPVLPVYQRSAAGIDQPRLGQPIRQQSLGLEVKQSALTQEDPSMAIVQISGERLRYARESSGLSVKQLSKVIRDNRMLDALIARGEPLPQKTARKYIEPAQLEAAKDPADCYEWQLVIMQRELKVSRRWLTTLEPMPALEGERIRAMLAK